MKLVLIAICCLALASCSPQPAPTSAYYEDLYYQVMRLKTDLRSSNNDVKALKPDLITDADAFLTSEKKYGNLATYKLFALADQTLHGHLLPGSGDSENAQEIELTTTLDQFSAEGFIDEPKRYHVEVDMDAIKAKVKQYLDDNNIHDLKYHEY